MPVEAVSTGDISRPEYRERRAEDKDNTLGKTEHVMSSRGS